MAPVFDYLLLPWPVWKTHIWCICACDASAYTLDLATFSIWRNRYDYLINIYEIKTENKQIILPISGMTCAIYGATIEQFDEAGWIKRARLF